MARVLVKEPLIAKLRVTTTEGKKFLRPRKRVLFSFFYFSNNNIIIIIITFSLCLFFAKSWGK